MSDRAVSPSFAGRFVRSCGVVVCALGLIAARPAVATASSDGQDEKGVGSHRALSLTSQSRKDILQWVLAHPGVAGRAPGHRLAGIRLTAAITTDPSGATKTIITVVLFDHNALEARRVVIDGTTGRLLSNERLPGRPQSSSEEFEEAVDIIRRDPEFARLLDQGAVLDGGFIVDDPAGSRRRAIQLKLLSANRLTLLRSITVDLTRRTIASSDNMVAAARSREPSHRSNGGR